MTNDLSKNLKKIKLTELVHNKKLEKAKVGTLPYIEVGDINVLNKEIIYKDKGSVKGAVIAPADSILISRVRPTRGAVTLLKKELTVSSAFTVLIPNNKIDIKLLYYFLAWNPVFYKYLERFQKGANYPSVSEKAILDFDIFVPSKKEQQRIVSVLEQAENLKMKRERANKKMEELIPALFIKMFGDPAINPKGWEMDKLGNLCQFAYGESLPKRDRVDGDVTVYGSNGEVGKHNFSITDGETIIVGRKGSVGKVSYSRLSCFPIDTAFYIDHNHTSQNIYWLYWLLRFVSLKSLSLMVGVPGLNRNHAYNLKVYKPPKEKQQEFFEKSNHILRVVMEGKNNDKIDKLYNSLMQKAFKGEL